MHMRMHTHLCVWERGEKGGTHLVYCNKAALEGAGEIVQQRLVGRQLEPRAPLYRVGGAVQVGQRHAPRCVLQRVVGGGGRVAAWLAQSLRIIGPTV